jgi:hypothetical protein
MARSRQHIPSSEDFSQIEAERRGLAPDPRGDHPPAHAAPPEMSTPVDSQPTTDTEDLTPTGDEFPSIVEGSPALEPDGPSHYDITHGAVGHYRQGERVAARDFAIPADKSLEPEDRAAQRSEAIDRLMKLGAIVPVYLSE